MPEDFNERCSIFGFLADGFIKENHATDLFTQARRRKKHFTVGATGFFGAWKFNRLKTFQDGWGAFVGSEDAFARCDQR